MRTSVLLFLAAAATICASPAAVFALTPYAQDFEGLSQPDADALANDGWLVFGNVFEPGGGFLYDYGPFPAPNDGSAFCAIVIGEGGAEQGDQQLTVYSDYNNLDHGNGNLIESNVFQEQTIGAADVGQIWTFAFQAKLGNIELASTALAFIKTLDPANGYALTNFVTEDMTTIPVEWNGYSLSLAIIPALEGQILQFGFANTATNYEGSGIFYDNVNFSGEAGPSLAAYSQDFEGLSQPDVDALANDGWLVFGNVFDPGGGFLYGYGPFPAPNDGAAFCAIVTGEGGVDQGTQQLSVYSDYNNLDHGNGNLINSNVFQEQTVGPSNVGETWIFDFQAKLGNIEAGSTALAFLHTLDPANGYGISAEDTEDMTAIPPTWAGYSLSLEITAPLVGHILQFGFANTATNYEGSGIYYDNVDFRDSVTDVPDGYAVIGADLRQNYPNPFNPRTQIEFSLDRPGTVELAVIDLAGRRVATLAAGQFTAGEHQLSWDGMADNGRPAPSGHYRYVLTTERGRVSRSMVLLK